MSNIRSLSDLNKKDGGGKGNAPPQGNSGMPPSGGGGGGGLGGLFGGLGGLMGMGGPQQTGGGGHDEGKNIKFIHKDSQFPEELKKAGGKLVVVDFTASWCGPCKMIAPHFKQMSEKYTNVVFLKVDVDECQDTAQACGIRAMPTFQFYKNSKKVDEFSGASPDKLQNLIEKNQGSSSGPSSSGDSGNFSGGGYVLGGGSKSSQQPTQPAPTTSTPQVSAPAPKEEADPILLPQLIDMGFPKEQSEKALIATGNKDIEQAINWIVEHPETPSSTSQPPVQTSTSTTSSEATTSTTSTSSKKLDPMDIDLDDDEEHFIIEEEKKKEQRALTPEEIEIEKRKLQERLAAIRARKAAEEKQAEIEREKVRIKEGKAAIEAKKDWEEKQLEREAAKKEREKQEDRKAKEKIQALLEQDKRERAAKLAKTSDASKQTQQAPVPAQAPKPVEQAPKKEYTEAVIQIRLLDGNTIKATFKPTDPLRTVHSHVALLVGNDRFTLNTTFPRKVYSPRDSVLDTTTLQQAECVPTGTFVVQKLM